MSIQTRKRELGMLRASSTVMLAAALVLGGLSGCSEDESTEPDVNSATPTTMEMHAGNNQSAAAGSAVTVAPSVLIKDQDGNPYGGQSVAFTVTSGGGSVAGTTAVSNSQGIAAVGSWTLGPTPGTNTLQAVAAGLSGSPVTFTATGTASGLPKWTFMVYLAADNSLAVAGLQDVDEMEAAGTDPDVKVVVEMEFSQSYLQQAGCGLDCLNLPNWNTFRYVITGEDTGRSGVNGTAQDLGTRNMADPSELTDFVSWAMQNHPAERYALVLWNHGGGYVGLIEDQTQGGHDLMTLSQLTQALTELGPIDIVDFDMCLMGAYETMVSMEGLAEYVVFSEEVVPGAGNPYTQIVDGIQQNKTASTSTIAQLFVDEFHQSYAGGRSSTTKSAYEMARFEEFDAALEVLATKLKTDLSVLSTAIGQAAGNAQAYSYKQLKDLVDFLTLLKQGTSDTELHSQIDAVITKATSGFRVANQFQNGGGGGYGQEPDVSRSTGMHILMPSGGASDQLGSGGGTSFESYQALYPSQAWTSFLVDWLSDAQTTPTQDPGESSLETFLVWSEEAIPYGVDIDLLVLEPDGNIYAPYMGPITPNGTFTEDSYATGESFEGYAMKSSVAQGDYFFLANLYSDPQSYQPYYDMLYRLGSDEDLTSFFAPDYPYLSMESSWLADPDPTWEELFGGAYSDLQAIMYITIGGKGLKSAGGPGSFVGISDMETPGRPSLTRAQIKTLERVLAAKQRVGGQR